MTAHTVEKGLSEKLEYIAHWFIALVGATYGCGFLIVFTFFKSYGVDSIDFIEAKYIHVGVLFLMSVLVIAMPLWWLIWPLRHRLPGPLPTIVRDFLSLPSIRERLRFAIISPLRWFFLPDWSVDAVHGINAVWAIRISMILLLWSFIILAVFSSPNFGRNHPKLAILDFLTPMVILTLGFLGDLFKGGTMSQSQYSQLRRIRFLLRVWWIAGGITCLFLFVISDFFTLAVFPFAMVYFGPPLVVIVVLSFHICWFPNRMDAVANMLSRIAIIQWTLYTIQWAVVVWQVWTFIWTIRADTLGISLIEVLLGENYFENVRQQFRVGDLAFPHGGIYFVFFILLICFFIIRNSYRLRQIGAANDSGHRRATLISLLGIIGPLSYISILAFAHTIYPYIPSEKGGGDYTKNVPVNLTFNTNTLTANGIQFVVSPQLASNNAAGHLIMLDENDRVMFFADITDAGGPTNWRGGSARPKMYQVHYEAISCITSKK